MTNKTETGNWNCPPWHPMSNPVDLKAIGKLGEELNECGSAVARCMIQGIDGLEPETGKPNRQWLEEEIADVELNIELVKRRFRLQDMPERKDRKRPLLENWHKEA